MASNHVRHRKFTNEWDEIAHLYHKLLYWLYNQENAVRARAYSDRLEQLLPQADPNHEAIFGEECWSLIHETKGNLPEAITCRENEIRLIRQLHAISKDQPYEQAALKGYDISDLSDRLNLLAGLYHDSGDLDRAIKTLEESRQLCIRHGIAFDAEDLLGEYLKERTNISYSLSVSENGTLLVEQAASDMPEKMPSSVTIKLEGQAIEAGRQTRRISPVDIESPSTPALPSSTPAISAQVFGTKIIRRGILA